MGDQLAAQLGVLTLSGPSKCPLEGVAAAQAGDAAAGPRAESVLAGLGPVLEALREAIAWPQRYAQEGAMLGVNWPRGLLLHGPPGVGKSAAVAAVAAECGATVHAITAASVFGAYTGESERRLRDAFARAGRDAARGAAVVIVLDELDALCPRRDAGREHEARVVGQLLTLLDGASSGGGPKPPAAAAGAGGSGGGGGGGGSGGGAAVGGLGGGAGVGGGEARHSGPAAGRVVVVGLTSRPNVLDPALRRPGRLDREVAVPVPDAAARGQILGLLSARLPLAPDVDLNRLAGACHGYTGADLAALCREAAMHAIAQRARQQQQQQQQQQEQQQEQEAGDGGAAQQPAPAPVSAADFEGAMARVGPSVARGAAVEFRPAAWEDVGGLPGVKHRLRQAVEWPLLHGDALERMGLAPPRGVLLHGPPGCSKTTLARAAATASRATFLALSGAALHSQYVGEGEALLRESFRAARLAAPSILFLDELDSLVGRRQEGEVTGEGAARLLLTLLTEMDGLELATGVLVLAATNRPEAIDAALLRPGRFDLILYVPPPDCEGRVEALRVHTRAMPLAPDADLAAVAAATERYTGAELAAVCREAAMCALREDMEGAACVAHRHFAAALAGVRPAFAAEELERYASWPPRRYTSAAAS